MGRGAQQVKGVPPQKYSWTEVRKHRTPEDAWMVCRGKVYDVSGWASHPGGTVIFTHAGDDFTDIFAAFHPPQATDALSKFYIGEIDQATESKSEEQLNFEKGYRELRSQLVTMGMFNASLGYYLWKVVSNLMIVGAAVLCVCLSSNFWVHMLGAVIMALFWQQCGWLAHDFLHHQVFKNRLFGDLMGLLVGDVFQGFSVAWWKNKHNTHHAVPNLHESSSDAHDGDPDIDTMPILAWSAKMAERAVESKMGRFMIKYQAIFYFPVLLFARLAWLHQSWVFVFGGAGQWSTKGAQLDMKRMQHQSLEKVGLVLYYVWNFALLWQMPFLHSVAFVILSQTACGFMLALVFGLGHNGMATYEASKRPDFWKLQVTTTRNVTSNLFVDWFCGGLGYQVDHHLFPSLPRHNLGKVHKLVESFCKEHGVTYHEAGIYDGSVEVLQHLNMVSREFLAQFPAM